MVWLKQNLEFFRIRHKHRPPCQKHRSECGGTLSCQCHRIGCRGVPSCQYQEIAFWKCMSGHTFVPTSWNCTLRNTFLPTSHKGMPGHQHMELCAKTHHPGSISGHTILQTSRKRVWGYHLANVLLVGTHQLVLELCDLTHNLPTSQNFMSGHLILKLGSRAQHLTNITKVHAGQHQLASQTSYWNPKCPSVAAKGSSPPQAIFLVSYIMQS